MAWAGVASAGPLAGTVLDGETLEPVAGATLAIEGIELRATSDEVGRYRFADAPVDAITVVVIAEGFAPTSEEIELTDEGLVDRVFALPPPDEASETLPIFPAIGLRGAF